MLPAPERKPRRFPWWILLGALVLSSLYLPTLGTRFDFIDDGGQVYPAPPMGIGDRLQLVWQKIVDNYETLGPFRPVLWAHWETAADLFGASELAWRLARHAWLMFAAATFLWLMCELRIHPVAAVLAGAIAMWNPYRNEIWTSLSLAEGIAMPYVLLAPVCAIRAARGSRAWRWDLAGVLCILAALGCKNTFAAVIPAQFLLRISPDGRNLLDGLRRHGKRAGLLSLTLLVPVVHFVVFKAYWRPGQYEPALPSWEQLLRMLSGVKGAVSLDFLGVGLALALIALALGVRLRAGAISETRPARFALLEAVVSIWNTHRAACLAGLTLFALGVGIYLPMNALSGRYTMPAVWGVDMLLAALLSSLMLPCVHEGWRRAAFIALGLGLVVVACANLIKQEKFAARAELLWRALEFVETTAPPSSCIEWFSGPDLNIEEGIHFQWHLQDRGRRKDVHIRLLDEEGQPKQRRELRMVAGKTNLVITGTSVLPPGETGRLLHEFACPWQAGFRQFRCYVWVHEPTSEHIARAEKQGTGQVLEPLTPAAR